MRAVQAASAASRLREARQFLNQFPPGREVLLLGASRGAVDDLARTIAIDAGATFGMHRLSFTQLAARVAAADLAASGQSPASGLGHEAVAARAAFEAAHDQALDYFAPVAGTPGFPKALARTLLELRLAGVASGSLQTLSRSGPDLAALLDRVDALMEDAGTSDRASLFAAATAALKTWRPMPTLVLDVPFESDAEAEFLWTLVARAPDALITVPPGDARTASHLQQRGIRLESVDLDHDHANDTDLSRLSRYLFSSDSPSERTPTGGLVWFSAPGEGRECVEIARRILKEAARGTPFDQMAILVRSPQHYIGVLEHALGRAGIRAYYDRGLRRPHPAGRAFLAILSCGVEDLSAKRFAEYLSLGQVPPAPTGDAATPAPFITSADESFGILSETPEPKAQSREPEAESLEPEAQSPFRSPWKWETLLVESAVIGGSQRWARRLDGLAAEFRLHIRELRDEDPDSPRIERIERELENLEHLKSFALPLIETIAGWPEDATWGDWIQRLEGFAPRVLKTPADVLRVLADLRPMGTVGPVGLAEVRDVLADRLRSLEIEPPSHRYGRVFVGSPHQARGRSFKVVFVPGLAERMFPQKLREDPLLLDDSRTQLASTLASGLPRKSDRADLERLLLRLALGAAEENVYVSFPRLETSEARARVPSFYALEIMRAVTGRVPDHQALETMAARESQANLAWPAPLDPHDAIDDFEHDLSTLRGLMAQSDLSAVKGRARYMLTLNDNLRRSVTERWARAEKRWSQFDGIVRVTDTTRDALSSLRLSTRHPAYSVSTLQKYAACPYQFFLSAAYRLAPLEEPEPLQRMDPLTKGSLFHQVQAEFFRALQARALAITPEHMKNVVAVLDDTLTRIAAEYYERLAPAVDRVWQDEISAIRGDLHVWADRLAKNPDWEPWLFEFAFGLPGQPGHDPASLKDPVTIDGRFILRGSVDLIERKRGTKVLRVTDHKTSKNRSLRNSRIGGGTQLQPIIYSLAVEQATTAIVEKARFSYCTTAGGFSDHEVPINEATRRLGIEVLEMIDRAVELGMLPPAPNERVCQWCDFLPVCGPDQARRANGKSKKELADLIELRGRP